MRLEASFSPRDNLPRNPARLFLWGMGEGVARRWYKAAAVCAGVLAQSGFKASALASASASNNGEVAREFACPKPSKAGLCPWPLIRHTACVGTLKEMISRVLENLPVFRFPAHSRG